MISTPHSSISSLNTAMLPLVSASKEFAVDVLPLEESFPKKADLDKRYGEHAIFGDTEPQLITEAIACWSPLWVVHHGWNRDCGNYTDALQGSRQHGPSFQPSP